MKPHRTKYWLNHNVTDEEPFNHPVRTICQLDPPPAQAVHEQGIPVVSVDEKTGIQALQRQHPTRNRTPGKPEAQEYEYERHSTVALIAHFEVATGQVIAPTLSPTRTEEDFVAHIQKTLETDPEAQWVFIRDPLNTPQSEGLVRLIAKACGLRDERGVKGRWGLLKSMASRAAFLPDNTHRIRWVYTPKHCSWLNQIEMGFGILTRR